MGNLCHVHGEEPQFGLESRLIKQDQNSLKEIDANDMPSSDYAVLANNNLIMLPAVEKARSQHKSHFKLFGKNSKYPLMKLVKKKGLYYQGPWKKGLEQGDGVVYGQDGSYLEGTFVQGKLNGKGAQIFNDGSIYQGDYLHGLFNGKGKFTYRINGMTYNGDWKDGRPNGIGEQAHPKVVVYKGHFLNGVKHTSTTTCKQLMEWEDGRKYVGPFKEGYMHGQGELTKSHDHGYYKGNFDKNNKTDPFKMKTQFGTYQGPFVNGQMEGHGIFTWNNGNIYRGEFKNNMLHGHGELTLNGKDPFKGTWENGVSTSVQN